MEPEVDIETQMLELAKATIDIRYRLCHKASRFWVYVLELNNGNFYVGETDNVWLRLVTHIVGGPSAPRWVKRHGFRRVIEIVRNAEVDAETTKTLHWMSMFGWERVRGAGWCALDMAGPPAALNTFDRATYTYDHLSPMEVTRVERTAREFSLLLADSAAGIEEGTPSPKSA